jgi:hypothetical protein
MWLITCYSFELCEEAIFLISKEKRNSLIYKIRKKQIPYVAAVAVVE